MTPTPKLADLADLDALRLRDALGLGASAFPRAPDAFWIDRAASLHIVLEGQVDVYAVQRSGTEAAGARHHLFRLGAGALLPAIARTPRAYGILAVATPGALVAPIQRATTSSTLSADAAVHQAALDKAVTLLVAAVTASTWATSVDGEATLTAVAPSHAALEQVWPALTHWLDRMLDLAVEEIAARSTREAARLKQKAAHTAAAMHDALSRFARLGRSATRYEPPVGDDSMPGADLFRACQQIGQQAGIHFTMPTRLRKEGALDRLEEIAQASRIRCRRVMLRGDWWTADNGPLLGFLNESCDDGENLDRPQPRPVALLPGRRGHCVLHDPASGRRQRVTRALAENIDSGAMSFYRALPAHRLSLRDLLDLGAHGLGPEALRLLVLGATVGLLGLAAPLLTGWLIDDAIPSADKSAALALAAVLAATGLTATLLNLAHAVTLLRVESRVDNTLQAAVWDRVLALPAAFFRRFATGDLALRINAINTLRQGISGAAMSSVLAGVFSLFNVGLLFWLAPGLAWLALSLIALALGVTSATAYLKLRCERQRAALAGKISGMVHQYLSGIVKLRICVAEARAFANWAAQYTKLRALTLRSMQWGNVEHVFFAGYGALSSAAVFAVAGTLLFKDTRSTLTTGEFVAFNSAFGLLFGTTMELSQTVLGLLKLVPVYERIRPILETLPESGGKQDDPGELSGDIEVQNLGYAYADGPAVLSGVSCHIRPGEFVAIVGPSGSGKSTLLRLLMGFERPQTGSVCYDGHNLLDVDMHALRRQLGVVLQSGQLMAGDIFGNIVGISSAPLDQAWEAARLCGLEADIDQMPMGMHTVIGEGSSTLSGGQRQRILIARAIVAKPRILFLDEATSALDNRTQQMVAESLSRLKVTRIVIAHRLSTIVNADRILVMQDGRLVQSGNYAELRGQTGLFAELARRQSA